MLPSLRIVSGFGPHSLVAQACKSFVACLILECSGREMNQINCSQYTEGAGVCSTQNPVASSTREPRMRSGVVNNWAKSTCSLPPKWPSDLGFRQMVFSMIDALSIQPQPVDAMAVYYDQPAGNNISLVDRLLRWIARERSAIFEVFCEDNSRTYFIA